MQWVLDNWIWIVLIGAMLAMHLFGHGKHGGHGDNPEQGSGCCGSCEKESESQSDAQSSGVPKTGTGIGTPSAAERPRDL